MAQVIHTGPYNAEICAFAKREAEKAERNPSYKPKQRGTLTHAIVYRKQGAQVKAIVVDQLAPITFPSHGSVLPIAPSFLDLHPQTPKKKYGKEHHMEASGNTLVIKRVEASLSRGIVGNNKYYITFPRLPARRFEYFQDITVGGTESSNFNLRDIVYRIYLEVSTELPWYSYSWIPSSGIGQFKKSTAISTAIQSIFNALSRGRYPNDFDSSFYPNDRGMIKNVSTFGHAFTSFEREWNEGDSAQEGGFDLVSSKPLETVGIFLHSDIREVDGDYENHMQTMVSYGASYTHYTYHMWKTYYGEYSDRIRMRGPYWHVANSVVAADGSVIFPFSKIDAEIYTVYTIPDYSPGGRGYKVQRAALKANASFGIAINLSNNPLFEHSALVDGAHDFRVHSFIPGTVAGFSGVYISVEIYESWREPGDLQYRFLSFLSDVVSYDAVLDKYKIIAIKNNVMGETSVSIERTDTKRKKYGKDSRLFQSRLATVFFVDEPEPYPRDDLHLSPPRIKYDGICLPHAWFSCNANGGYFYKDPNDYNHISVVILPEGRQKFALEEVEHFAVELKHPPCFFAKSGSTIRLSWDLGEHASVSYTVKGLERERDETGEETGFYIASSTGGSISGVSTGDDVDFKISPRQPNRKAVVTVKARGEGKHSRAGCVQFAGEGTAALPEDSKIDLELANKGTILAGQDVRFHISAPHLPNGTGLDCQVFYRGVPVALEKIYVTDGAAMATIKTPLNKKNGYLVSPNLYERDYSNDDAWEAAIKTPRTEEFLCKIIHPDAGDPVRFSVLYSHKQYTEVEPKPPKPEFKPFFSLALSVSHDGETFFNVRDRHRLVERLWYSTQSRRAYALFWDGMSCDISRTLRKSPGSNTYERNPDWQEVAFDYPPAADPYNTKGALEPYVYKYLEYEKAKKAA